MEKQMSDAERGRSHVIDKKSFTQPTVAAFSMQDYRPEMSRQAGLRTVIERGTSLKQFKSANGVIQRKPVSQKKFDKIIAWLTRTGLTENPLFKEWYLKVIQPGYDFGNDPGVFTLSFLCNDLYMGMDKQAEDQAIEYAFSKRPVTIHDFAVIYKMYCHIYQRSKFEAVRAELSKPAPVTASSAKPGLPPPPATGTPAFEIGRPKKSGRAFSITKDDTPLKLTPKVTSLPPSRVIKVEKVGAESANYISVISHPHFDKVQSFVSKMRMDEVVVFKDIVLGSGLTDDSPEVQFWDVAIDYVTKSSVAPHILKPAIVFAMHGKSFTEQPNIQVSAFITLFNRAVAALAAPMKSPVVKKIQGRMDFLFDFSQTHFAAQPGLLTQAPLVAQPDSIRCLPHHLDLGGIDFSLLTAIRTAAAEEKLYFPSPLDAVNHMVKHATAYKQDATGQQGKVVGGETNIVRLLKVYLRRANTFIARPDLVPGQEVDVTFGRFAYTFEDNECKAIVTCKSDGSDPRIATFFPKEEYNMVDDLIPFF